MANGAMNEVRLFSTASMMIVMTSSAVRMTSRNKPWTGSVPDDREFSAWSFPGSSAETTPAAVIAPKNWTGITHRSRTQSKAPAIQSPMATCVYLSVKMICTQFKSDLWEQAYRWVEHSTTNPIKDPHVYAQTEAENGSDI